MITMDYEYDESSQEVVTTIAMIKSMATTLRRKSSTTWIPTATNSPILPQINNGKRGSYSRNLFATSNDDASKSPWFNPWSARDVALAGIEFKRRLEKRKSKPQNDFEIKTGGTKRSSVTERQNMTEKELQRITVLKSVFVDSEDKTNNPAGNFHPRTCSSSSRKSIHTKKAPSRAKPLVANASDSELPTLSVMKITPQIRPSFHHRTKATSLK